MYWLACSSVTGSVNSAALLLSADVQTGVPHLEFSAVHYQTRSGLHITCTRHRGFVSMPARRCMLCIQALPAWLQAWEMLQRALQIGKEIKNWTIQTQAYGGQFMTCS